MDRLKECARMRLITLVIGLFLMVGCVPCSEHPLSIPGQDELDSRLYGTWFHKEDDETVFIHFGLDDKSRLMKVVFVSTKKDGELEHIEFIGHNTNSKDFRYLNLKWVNPDGDCPGYLFVKYALSENALGICIADFPAIQKAIENGELKGEISKSSTMLQDEPEKMKDFFEKHDRELFPEMHYMQKL